MGGTAILGTIGVVIVSFIVALGVDHLLPTRPKTKRTVPMIGITMNLTDRFMAIWIVSGVIVFLLSVVVGVLTTGQGR